MVADRPVRLLYVDADPAALDRVRTSLEATGLRVETAASVREGLDRLLTDGPFDCVLSGGEPPEAGVPFLRAVREQSSELPFVLLLADDLDGAIPAAIRAGLTDWLPKQRAIERNGALAERIRANVERRCPKSRSETSDWRARERRLSALHEASRELMAATTAEDVAEIATEAARDVLDLPVNAVYLLAADRDVLLPTASTQAASDLFGEIPTIARGEGILWEAVEDGETRVYGDVRTAAGVKNPRTPVRSELMVPLGDHGGFIAASTAIGDLDDSDVSLAKVLAANAEAALDRAERETELEGYETVVETVPDGVLTLDATGTITNLNDAMASLLGRPAEALLGEFFPALIEAGVVSEQAVSSYLDAVRELLSGETDHTRTLYNVELTPEPGRRHVCEVNVALLPFEEEFRGSVCGVREVTERTEYERELRRQNERLDEFVGVVSHDLRNPLNVIRGRLELARETGEPEHFEAIERGTDRMTDLLEELLALAKQGEVLNEPQSVSIEEVARQAWTEVETTSATLSVEAGLGEVSADRTRLAELLGNLFRNSVEHSSTSSRPAADGDTGDEEAITVTVGSRKGGFRVADDGPGIPAAERETVFERGYTSSADGTGFGLAIVSTIAEAHGWTVSVAESEAGGARFDVEYRDAGEADSGLDRRSPVDGS